MNTPRPIVAGGTGATSARDALFALKAEIASEEVTNFDTHPFISGSFWAGPGATSSPVPGSYVTGVCYLLGPNSIFLEARPNGGGLGAPAPLYVREKNTTWGAWNANVNAGAVNASGPITATQQLIINKPSSGTTNQIVGQTNHSPRWLAYLGDNAAESGSNAGSNFSLFGCNDDGTTFWPVMNINRQTKLVTIQQSIYQIAVAGAVLGAGPGFGNTNTGFSIQGSSAIAFFSASGGCASFNANADGILTWFFRSGVSVGNISVTTTGCAFNTASDARLKDDLKSFDAGKIVDNTNVYDFRWKSTGERSYGVIAQQAAEVYSAPTTYIEKEDRWYIDYSKYIPVLLQELKALRVRVAELEGRLAVKPA